MHTKEVEYYTVIFSLRLKTYFSSLDIKVEYHANENPLTNSEKIAYIGQRLMYPTIKKKKQLTMLVFLNVFKNSIF